VLVCAQRGAIKPNQGKGRKSDAHCDSCRRWLKETDVAPGPTGAPMVEPSAPYVVCGANSAAGVHFVVTQAEGEALGGTGEQSYSCIRASVEAAQTNKYIGRKL
jgi:hypothetical protein